MKRIALLIGLVLAALPAPALAQSVRVSPAAGATFPDRAYTLTLPDGAALPANAVQVYENGSRVAGATVRSAADSKRFGVVLAIDTSPSMSGKPLRGAVAAAHAFLARRQPGQPIALITFAGAVDVVQPFTTDAAALERSLDDIHVVGGGSRMLDAGTRAVELIRAARMSAGSIVLLGDGADRASNTSQSSLESGAKAAGARIYTVGLHSRSADFAALTELANATGGEFAAASATDLTAVFDRLGALLSHQYLISYRSPAGPHTPVKVEVRVAGVGSAEANYQTPALGETRVPYYRPPGTRFWLASGTPLLISLVVAVLLTLAIWVLLRPRHGTVRERLAQYVREASGSEDGNDSLTGKHTSRSARLSLNRHAWWTEIRERFDIGRIPMPPERALTWTVIATVIVFVIAVLVMGPIGIVFAPLVPAIALMIVNRAVAKQRAAFAAQLPDNLQIIASAMRAGHSFVGALQVVVDDAPEPTRSELERVLADERLGVPLEEAFEGAVTRMESRDLEQVALVAALQRETGGNTAEVIDRVNVTMRERLALRRLVSSLTAQGRMSRWVLTGLPVVLLLLLTAMNSAYMRPLYTTPLGKGMLLGIAVMVTSGSLVIKKIVDIKV